MRGQGIKDKDPVDIEELGPERTSDDGDTDQFLAEMMKDAVNLTGINDETVAKLGRIKQRYPSNTIRKLRFVARFFQLYSETRLHSSKMHTARVLTVSPSMLCAGGVCFRGCTWS